VQNLLPAVRAGELAVPYSVETRFGLVDLADVGAAAAAVLAGPGHVGATYELGGPALVSVTDVARAAGEVLGRPVPARRTDIDPDVHPWLRAMFDYYEHHGLPTGPLPLRALLGREPTSVREVLIRELVSRT
jgi:NAD(P)H dehydrogenase (quinone)